MKVFSYCVCYHQLLVGTPGNEPEECARDFIKDYYQYYPCGVYWYDVSSELILETCVKVATEVRIEYYIVCLFDLWLEGEV